MAVKKLDTISTPRYSRGYSDTDLSDLILLLATVQSNLQVKATSIKQSPVVKVTFFLSVIKQFSYFIGIEPLLIGHLS